MNKELTELRELITEREKMETDFQASVVKLDGRIAAMLTKLQGKATAEPKPVGPITYTRDKPRKPRSDKGKPRTKEPEMIDPAFMQPQVAETPEEPARE